MSNAEPILPMQRRALVDSGSEQTFGDTKFEYKGYKVTCVLNDDDFFDITYNPTLLRKIERMYSRCKNKSQCKEFAIKAIDLAQAAQTQASGQAAQAGSAALDDHGGPLERANG